MRRVAREKKRRDSQPKNCGDIKALENEYSYSVQLSKSLLFLAYQRKLEAYATYHATRKTASIVKGALDPQSSVAGLKFPWRITYLSTPSERQGLSWVQGDGWAPFNGSDGTALLGQLDVAFLAVYAFGMYFSGHLGDRMNLRIFLAVGMVGTGLLTSLFGAGYWANIHSFYYFLIVQMIAGLFQSTGWPSVVAVVGNWCGKKKRGLVMGIWNAHTSIGNITGSLVASVLLSYGWGWSFVVPGLLVAFMGIVVFLLLPVSPESVGADREEEEEDDEVDSPKKNGEGLTEPLLGSDTEIKETAVGFMEAWRIPGVAPFALCLFFAKLVAYTFLYWLPYYISHTAIEGKYLSDETAGNLSTFFDVGGVLGGILAGHISDRLDARAITAATFIRLGNTQFLKGKLQGIGNCDSNHRRNGFCWSSDRTVINRLHLCQQLECSFYDAHGSSSCCGAAVDKACSGRGSCKDFRSKVTRKIPIKTSRSGTKRMIYM
ncbi:hypothetical protein V6N12_037597 [Hibiscus sabdariffa]|uniref:Major facilitator superfamily (MFS) profile domain-containing protein n=1 Tax=Hibiscus sabdariffa TaxID=183260 RepID=A0ABR2C149_9ROSI